MRGRHPRGYRRTPRVIALEEEFGEPLPAIIAGFAGRYNLNSGIWEDDK